MFFPPAEYGSFVPGLRGREFTSVWLSSRSSYTVNKERQTVEKDGLHYRCELREGKFFIVNALAFSVPIGSDISAVPDLIG